MNGAILIETAGWLMLALAVTGCRVVESAAQVPGQVVTAVTPGGKSPAQDPAALQVQLQRFADEYAGRTTAALDDYVRRLGTADARSQALRWKVAVSSATVTIATGPNPQANLLDFLALATITRMALEEVWVKTTDGPAFEPWLAVSRNLETNAWNLAGGVFPEEQQQELRNAIQRWWDLTPDGHLNFFARPEEFSSLIRQTSQKSARPGSVFAFVGLDPTAGLDPAVREVTHARLLAERAMFMAQRMPFLLRWQVDLLTDQLLREERIEAVLTNAPGLSASADRISRALESASATAAELPDRITAERQAVLEALEAQESGLRELSAEVTRTLVAGESMAASLNTTLITFDALMKRLGVGEPSHADKPPATDATPFRILDYARTATQLEATARQLTVLLERLDQTLGSTNLAQLSAQVGPVVAQAQTGGRELVDYVFWRSILLLAVALLAGLGYRWLSGRLATAKRS
ncbi:MAG: hypothetical protein KJ072_11220 [Verrucomicrobia bacterium]|nr:hypothetical protein [Verrucomicrobiota bacterium]